MWEQNIFSKKEKNVPSTKIYLNKSRGKQRKPWYMIRTYMKSISTKKMFEGDILKQHVWESLWEFKIAPNHDREGWKQKKTCENDSLTKDIFGPTSARKLEHLFVRKNMKKTCNQLSHGVVEKEKEIKNKEAKNNRGKRMQKKKFFKNKRKGQKKTIRKIKMKNMQKKTNRVDGPMTEHIRT